MVVTSGLVIFSLSQDCMTSAAPKLSPQLTLLLFIFPIITNISSPFVSLNVSLPLKSHSLKQSTRSCPSCEYYARKNHFPCWELLSSSPYALQGMLVQYLYASADYSVGSHVTITTKVLSGLGEHSWVFFLPKFDVVSEMCIFFLNCPLLENR